MRVQIIYSFEYKKVTFYSAQQIDDEFNNIGSNEFSDFQERMSSSFNPKDNRQLLEIEKKIVKIGDQHGALFDLFKRENQFERLPEATYRFYDSSEDDNDFGLRLYCIRYNEEIVVLLNGDRKTRRNPRLCPNCQTHFKFANALSIAFYDAILRTEIEIKKRDILTEDDFYLDIEID